MDEKGIEKKNLYLSLDWKGIPEEIDDVLTQLNQVISGHVLVSDLRRRDVRDGALEATCFVDVENPDDLSKLIDDLQKLFSGIGVTFIDQNQMPSV
jgi:hypothetical protein